MKARSEEKKQSNIEQRASRTAMMAAIHRFLASKEERPYFQGPDHLAMLFLPPKAKFFLSFGFMRRYVRKKLRKGVPGTYEYMTARTKHFDTLFQDALKEDIPQIVVLGAGYDTRAIRFQEAIQHTKIFELDAPTTQQEKKTRLQQANMALPQQLTFVPINFSNERLETVLLTAGYDPSQRSLFLWEGVTYYLPEEAVKEPLALIKNHSGRGSTVAFDYFYKSVIEGTCEYYGAKEIHESVSKFGEPFQFGIQEGEIESFLAEHGFELLSHHTPDEFEKTYLYDDHGDFFGKMYGFACHVYARVKP
jgi:methyltransferase (TIGR00027 family)